MVTLGAKIVTPGLGLPSSYTIDSILENESMLKYSFNNSPMNTSVKIANQNNEARYIDHLLKTVLEDPLIRKRFIEMLQLSPNERRLILNNWIESYWTKNTGPEIIQALACLFDETLLPAWDTT